MLYSTKTLSEAFVVADPIAFKIQVFKWASKFEVYTYLDHNDYGGYDYKSYDLLLAAGVEDELIAIKEKGAFEDLKEFYNQKKDWLFGYLGYDLKNDTETLSSSNFDGVCFPPMHFFQPTYVIELKGNIVTIHSKSESPFSIFQKILLHSTHIISGKNPISPKPSIAARMPKQEYLDKVDAIRQHIRKGDIYEMNFCQEFYLEDFTLTEKEIFWKLNQATKAPFSSFYKLRNRFLLSSSPERFLKKEGNKLISQPIKGTIKRGCTPAEDIVMQNQLFESKKDRSENVMIVDLVRNDLSKSCVAGSVEVEELFGVKTFTNVHHLVSTVSGQIKENIHFVDAIKNAFPMGSMTGTPKMRSMELIEQFELTKRGLYSGAVGYITPFGDFDFNVVIRSIFYSASEKYLSFQVGGAIVYDSVSTTEYEECLLKAKGILSALGLHKPSSDQIG